MSQQGMQVAYNIRCHLLLQISEETPALQIVGVDPWFFFWDRYLQNMKTSSGDPRFFHCHKKLGILEIMETANTYLSWMWSRHGSGRVEGCFHVLTSSP